MKLTLIIVAILACTTAFCPPKISSTEALINAMHRQYKGKWARTITFTQYNTHYTADTVKGTSIWYEAIQYPDKFRIDFGLPTEGNAVIFADDSVYNFKEGKLKTSLFRINNLMLLAGGVNFLTPTKALKRLQDAGYNTALFREDIWQGRPVYVVGANKGDEKTAQFWVDAEKLYLVRTINPTPDGHAQDAHFSKHIRTAGGWTETEVLFLKDGKKQQLEVYKEVKANPALPEDLFSPQHFGKVHWMQ